MRYENARSASSPALPGARSVRPLHHGRARRAAARVAADGAPVGGRAAAPRDRHGGSTGTHPARARASCAWHVSGSSAVRDRRRGAGGLGRRAGTGPSARHAASTLGHRVAGSSAGPRRLVEGVPYPVYAMRPAGYLGRRLARAEHANLGVADDPDQWTDDDILWVLSRRGTDVPGNLILGAAAYDLWARQALADPQPLAARDLGEAYARLADEAVATNGGGSNAAGEFPKFAALRDLAGAATPHVLVGFRRGRSSPRCRSPSSARHGRLRVRPQSDSGPRPRATGGSAKAFAANVPSTHSGCRRSAVGCKGIGRSTANENAGIAAGVSCVA